jgi:hypothetical protein
MPAGSGLGFLSLDHRLCLSSLGVINVPFQAHPGSQSSDHWSFGIHLSLVHKASSLLANWDHGVSRPPFGVPQILKGYVPHYRTPFASYTFPLPAVSPKGLHRVYHVPPEYHFDTL